jgi:hypothetical protein
LNSHNSHVVINLRDVSLNVGMIITVEAVVEIMVEAMATEEDKFHLVQ